MPTVAVERAVRSARRRLAAQKLLDHLTGSCTVSLAVGFLWLLAEPGQLSVPGTLLIVAVAVAAVRVARDYPTPTAAALEIDARFGLRERVTAVIGLTPEQRETAVGRAVEADAESHLAGVRVASRFALKLRRPARLFALTAILFTTTAFLWNPVTESGLFTGGEQDQTNLAKKTRDNAPPPVNPFPKPNPGVGIADKPRAERLAAIRADLDRLDRESRKREGDPQWLAELTAVEDAARAVERESFDRLARMEAQLKQLEPLAKSPDLKEGPASDAAKSLAGGDLNGAEKALGELAKAVAQNPSDPQLRKQLEQLKDGVRRAAENTAAREKLEDLIEQAKKDGRDPTGLQQDLDRAKAEQSQPLKDLADKLEQAAKQMEKGDATQAAKQLTQAAGTVSEIRKDAQAAQDAQGQAERAGQLRADAGKKGSAPTGTAGAGERPKPPSGDPLNGIPKEDRARIPFIDPKGATSPVGSGELGGGAFTKVDPSQLAPAIRNAVRAAPAAVSGPPLTPADRAAVREFFELLGK